MTMITMREAVRNALKEEMERDPKVFLMGLDIGEFGGVLQVTSGLYEQFGEERVRDCPISESAMVGAGVGAALKGMRPVVEVMFPDFLTVSMDQIVNSAAKARYGFQDDVSVPMVIRTAFGGGTHSAMFHSQNIEVWFVHVAGLKVVMPSNPYDCKGLLKAAIRDPDPVLFFEHKLLYAKRGEVPDDDYVVPIGKAKVCREGRDLTMVAWGIMVDKCLKASETLASEGIEAEVIDLRTLSPIDKKTIVESVIKTGRLLVSHEACLNAGLGAEIAAIAAKEAFGYLDAPIERVTAPNTPVPFSPPLEKAFLPQVEDVLEGARFVLGLKS